MNISNPTTMNYNDVMENARLRKARLVRANEESKLSKRRMKIARQAKLSKEAATEVAKKLKEKEKQLAKQLVNKQGQKHPLLVLPRKRAKVIEEFSYILSGRKQSDNFTSWTSVTVSADLESQFPIFVLAKVEEFTNDEHIQLVTEKHHKISANGLDYVLLGLAFESACLEKGVGSFDTDFEFETMKKNMNSQVEAKGKSGKGLNHFGSSARGVFSFGKTAKYTLEGGTQSSVSDFSFKMGVDEDVKIQAKKKALSYLKKTLVYLAEEIDAHLSVDAVNLTNSLLDKLNERAAGTCLANLLGLEQELQGYAAGHFNYGYSCHLPHSERDSTYTLLHVPLQNTKDKHSGGTWFEWFTTKGNCIKIPMHEGVVILFSAYGLSHRQQFQAGPSLMNLSFYGNKSLVEKGNCSIDRAISKLLNACVKSK